MRTTKQKRTPPEKYPDHSWINDDPLEEEIEYDEKQDAFFIPIFFIEKKLFRLDPFWGTENFRFQFLKSTSGLMFADGSLELVVNYGGRVRKLVGAATVLIPADTDFNDPKINSNFSATIKSISTSNASRPIGNSFGANLNERDVIRNPMQKTQKNGKQKPPPVKKSPNEKIQQQYNISFEEGNGLVAAIEAIYDISYTGTKQIENAKS